MCDADIGPGHGYPLRLSSVFSERKGGGWVGDGEDDSEDDGEDDVDGTMDASGSTKLNGSLCIHDNVTTCFRFHALIDWVKKGVH